MSGKKFEHLSLPLIYMGNPKLPPGRSKKIEKTETNKINRIEHGEKLIRQARKLSKFWKDKRIKSVSDIQLGIPVLLEIDTSQGSDFLEGLGFEIVCELNNGYILVATPEADFTKFEEKIDKFKNKANQKCDSPARVYGLCEENDRLKKILSKNLYEKWPNLSAGQIYTVDISISCNGGIKLPKKPSQGKEETDTCYEKKKENWKIRYNKACRKWDDLKDERQGQLEEFVLEYNGSIDGLYDNSYDNIISFPDSFSARITISGAGLRDLVLNFPCIYEISEPLPVCMETSEICENGDQEELKLQQPNPEDPIICIIDSGIQEYHKYLFPAIKTQDSESLISNGLTADEVPEGGHGTRVAGAVLYPHNIPRTGTYQLPCWIRNFRVLDKDNRMPKEVNPTAYIPRVVKKYFLNDSSTKIFNHSIGCNMPCEQVHMSPWAATIDQESYENDVLFIQAIGNVAPTIISSYWRLGYKYPSYFDEEPFRIADPAQSVQALAVGSVSDTDFIANNKIALGKKMEISAFSRSGPGIWDTVKPDVVEYGGTYVYDPNDDILVLTTPPEVCPELIRKSPEGPAFARDDVGTSFSTPKVTNIAMEIQKILPESPALLYRALVVQSARWPDNIDGSDREKCIEYIKHIGYGIPNLERAVSNNEFRVTLITPELCEIGVQEAHVFQIPIPESISSVGEDSDILIEITLSYAAKPRPTRRYLRNYLSTWLDWRCSNVGETPEDFSKRIFIEGKKVNGESNFKWIMGDATNYGAAEGFSKQNNGTIQKDWCIMKSNQLSDAFCIAVRGHHGWGDDFKAKYSLVVSFEALNKDIPIYEPIKMEVEAAIQNQNVEFAVHNEKIEIEI